MHAEMWHHGDPLTFHVIAKSCDDHMDPSDTHTHRGSTSVLADWSTCVCLGVVEGHINACNIRVLMRSLSMSYC